MEKLLLDVSEASALLSLGRVVTYRLIMSGELESLKVGRRRLVPRIAIERFVERQLAEQAG